jgi:hypothetical protein
MKFKEGGNENIFKMSSPSLLLEGFKERGFISYSK